MSLLSSLLKQSASLESTVYYECTLWGLTDTLKKSNKAENIDVHNKF